MLNECRTSWPLRSLTVMITPWRPAGAPAGTLHRSLPSSERVIPYRLRCRVSGYLPPPRRDFTATIYLGNAAIQGELSRSQLLFNLQRQLAKGKTKRVDRHRFCQFGFMETIDRLGQLLDAADFEDGQIAFGIGCHDFATNRFLLLRATVENDSDDGILERTHQDSRRVTGGVICGAGMGEFGCPACAASDRA